MTYRFNRNIFRTGSLHRAERVLGTKFLNESWYYIKNMHLSACREFFCQVRCHPHSHGPEANESNRARRNNGHFQRSRVFTEWDEESVAEFYPRRSKFISNPNGLLSGELNEIVRYIKNTQLPQSWGKRSIIVRQNSRSFFPNQVE
jgi:hypothetical protein